MSEAINITLRLSESLLSIYRDSGNMMGEVVTITLMGPLSVHEILEHAGISSFLTPLISVDGQICSLNHIVNHDSVITLIGPLAGG